MSMQRCLLASGSACLLALVIACGLKPANNRNDAQERREDQKPQPAGAESYKFGDEAREGDLAVTVVEVLNEGPFAGQFRGQFRQFNGTVVHVKIRNLSAGKIASW